MAYYVTTTSGGTFSWNISNINMKSYKPWKIGGMGHKERMQFYMTYEFPIPWHVILVSTSFLCNWLQLFTTVLGCTPHCLIISFMLMWYCPLHIVLSAWLQLASFPGLREGGEKGLVFTVCTCSYLQWNSTLTTDHQSTSLHVWHWNR